MAEVDAPALQAKVLHLAGAAAEAGRQLAYAEAQVVAAARQHWHGIGGMHRTEPAAKVLQPA